MPSLLRQETKKRVPMRIQSHRNCAEGGVETGFKKIKMDTYPTFKKKDRAAGMENVAFGCSMPKTSDRSRLEKES